MTRVIIYTDGSCAGNPGPGGWAAVLIFPSGVETQIYGATADTTNQRMELAAAIGALTHLQMPTDVTLHSDSAYLVNCFRNRWFDNWRSNGWRNAKRKPVENRDLWERLLVLNDFHTVEFAKVRGHGQDAYNNRCDELARLARDRQPSELVVQSVQKTPPPSNPWERPGHPLWGIRTIVDDVSIDRDAPQQTSPG